MDEVLDGLGWRSQKRLRWLRDHYNNYMVYGPAITDREIPMTETQQNRLKYWDFILMGLDDLIPEKVRVAVVDSPSGFCPTCSLPFDDHLTGVGEFLCPAHTPNNFGN